MKPHFFLILLTCALLIGSAQAITITPAKYQETMNPDSFDSFSFRLTADNPGETTITATTNGDCASWLTFSPKDGTLPLVIAGTIHPPKNTPNGYYTCSITSTQPANGMVALGISYPFQVTITGGADPTPTPTPIITKTPAPVLTTQQIPAEPTATVTAQAPPPEPTKSPMNAIILGMAALCCVFGIVSCYQRYKTGRW